MPSTVRSGGRSPAERAQTERNGGRVSWPEYVSLVVPFAVAALAFTTKVLGLFIHRALLVATPVAAVALVAAITFDATRPRRHRTARWQPAALALAVAQVAVAATFLWRIGVDLVPRVSSSDFGSHGGIVTWIADNQTMPSPSRWSATLSAYPSGGHLAAALLSMISPLQPLESLWVVTLIALIGTWPVLCLMARHLATRTPWFASALVLFFVFAAYRYTVGIVTYDYFFAQLTGQWLAFSGVARILCDLRRMRSHSPEMGPGPPHLTGIGVVSPIWIAVVLAGSVLCYPQSSVLLLGCLGAVVLFGPVPRRIRYGLILGCLSAIAVFLAILSRTLYWNVQLLAGFHGEVAHVRLGDVGGPIGVLLAVLGLILVVWSARSSPSSIAFVGAVVGPAAVVMAMISLRAGFPVRVNVSDYRIAKNVYGLAPLGAVCAAIATSTCFGWILDHLPAELRREVSHPAADRSDRIQSNWLMPIGAGFAACLALGAVRAPGVAVRRIYDPDLYNLGLSLPPAQRVSVGLVAPWVEVNIMRWAGIGQPIGPDAPVEFPRTERWRTWPDDRVQTDYLLVSGPLAQRYKARRGVVVERQLGSAMLLHRTG